jgi:hypothetical protein
MMKIFGAGLAGLLAGCHFQRATILEAGKEDVENHKAVLRFRSSAVGDSVGIDFRKVKVHKGLWDGKDVTPSIMHANQYSMKVIGRLADRSIWNLDACERFIAPEDFIALLAERCAGRIVWEHKVSPEEFANPGEAKISTIPLKAAAAMLGEQEAPDFNFAPITVRRWKIPNADVFQTIYFPSPETTLYRASITGDLLIAEYAGESDDYDLFAAFGLFESDCTPIEKVAQRYGKISPVEDAWRKKFIFDMTTQHNIYSLGRFATWRNLLLDDVLQDICVLKKLMKSSSYERQKINSK